MCLHSGDEDFDEGDVNDHIELFTLISPTSPTTENLRAITLAD
jgi:hypothetical protein